ncbi:hypothetical protein F4806DRAFT_29927 [Annulohypoxylon nitens]|nr:hypothetical protein F4806DRAFT_29927 [Annulohypoxylon nitens]
METRARSVCEKIIDIENVMHESMDYLGSYPNYERPKMNGARMPTTMSTVRGVGCGKKTVGLRKIKVTSSNDDGKIVWGINFFFLDVVLVWRCLIAITRRNIKPVRGSFPTSQKNAPSSSRHPPKPKHTWQLRIDRIFTPPSLERLKLFYASKLSQLYFIIRRSTPSTQSPTSSYLRASTQHPQPIAHKR